MKKVIVGSTSEHKIEAVKEALLRLGVEAEVVGVKTESGVNEQPVGFKEIYQGALNRARELYEKYPDDIRVGTENGIVGWGTCSKNEVFDPHFFDLALIVVMLPDGAMYRALSSGIEFSEEYVYDPELNFAQATVGSIIAKKLGGDKTDPHKTLTHGRVRRKETLIEGVRLAFAQIPDLESI